MPLIATRGASSVQGFGQFAQSGPVNYIEEVFSSYLYTGTGATGQYLDQTIVNGIDLAGKGGMVWLKPRESTTYQDNMIYDTARGVNKWMMTNTTGQEYSVGTNLSQFNSNGFTLGVSQRQNADGVKNVAWTFRKQPKFFDVVTWTGNGVQGRLIPHNLGSVPGCIFVKITDYNGIGWAVYHRSLDISEHLRLDSTAAKSNLVGPWAGTAPTSTTFAVANDGLVNSNGYNYVAYVFAHDAGGFGLTGLDNVISCGSFVTDGSGNVTVDLGYEPQWVMIKNSSGAGYSWNITDDMRGMVTWSSGNPYSKQLNANSSGADENSTTGPTSTGFTLNNSATNSAFIYIAIRRGPMKVPTLGTNVYNAIARTGTSTAGVKVTGVGFPPDLSMISLRTGSTGEKGFISDRLRGTNVENYLHTSGANAQTGDNPGFISLLSLDMDGHSLADTNVYGTRQYYNNTGFTYIDHFFRRAPGFFDVVNWYITGSADLRIKHNLTVTPELIIPKAKSQALAWYIYHKDIGVNGYAVLNTTAAASSASGSFGTPTATEIGMNTSGFGYTSFNYAVSYLFATCPGVSKVGSYTGTGTTLQINCGFTTGARFVLIKRTDSTGDWYVWDTTRGIIAGNDPYLLLNSTAAEVTSTDYIDTYNAGFELSSTAPAAINANAGTYIFLAIA